uniref:Uncharacterized protein n=1 Tax=Plectus sambesii TaxID=2011161 RepID=A0A914VL23_9BILA
MSTTSTSTLPPLASDFSPHLAAPVLQSESHHHHLMLAMGPVLAVLLSVLGGVFLAWLGMAVFCRYYTKARAALFNEEGLLDNADLRAPPAKVAMNDEGLVTFVEIEPAGRIKPLYTA